MSWNEIKDKTNIKTFQFEDEAPDEGVDCKERKY